MQSLISIVHQDFQLIGKCKRIRFKKTLKLPRARRSNGRARPWGGHSGGGGGAISVIFLLRGGRCSSERSYCTREAIIWITLVCTNVTRLEQTSPNAEEIRSQGTWSHKKQSKLASPKSPNHGENPQQIYLIFFQKWHKEHLLQVWHVQKNS